MGQKAQLERIEKLNKLSPESKEEIEAWNEVQKFAIKNKAMRADINKDKPLLRLYMKGKGVSNCAEHDRLETITDIEFKKHHTFDELNKGLIFGDGIGWVAPKK